MKGLKAGSSSPKPLVEIDPEARFSDRSGLTRLVAGGIDGTQGTRGSAARSGVDSSTGEMQSGWPRGSSMPDPAASSGTSPVIRGV